MAAAELVVDLYGGGGRGGQGDSCSHSGTTVHGTGGSGGSGAFVSVRLLVDLEQDTHGFPQLGVDLNGSGTALLYTKPHVGYGLDRTTKVYGSSSMIAMASAGTNGYNTRMGSLSVGGTAQCGVCPPGLSNSATCGKGGSVGRATFSFGVNNAFLNASVMAKEDGTPGLSQSYLGVKGPAGTVGSPFLSYGTGGAQTESTTPDTPGAGAVFVWLRRGFTLSSPSVPPITVTTAAPTTTSDSDGGTGFFDDFDADEGLWAQQHALTEVPRFGNQLLARLQLQHMCCWRLWWLRLVCSSEVTA